MTSSATDKAGEDPCISNGKTSIADKSIKSCTPTLFTRVVGKMSSTNRYVKLLPKVTTLQKNSSTQTSLQAFTQTDQAVYRKASISTQTDYHKQDDHSNSISTHQSVFPCCISYGRNSLRPECHAAQCTFSHLNLYSNPARILRTDEFINLQVNQSASMQGCNLHNHNISNPLVWTSNPEAFCNPSVQVQSSIISQMSTTDIGVGPCHDLSSITPSDFSTQTPIIATSTPPVSNAEFGTQTNLSTFLNELANSSSSNMELQCELGDASLHMLTDSTSQTINDLISFGTQTNTQFNYQVNDQFATQTDRSFEASMKDQFVEQNDIFETSYEQRIATQTDDLFDTETNNEQFSSPTVTSTQSNCHFTIQADQLSSCPDTQVFHEGNDQYATQTDDIFSISHDEHSTDFSVSSQNVTEVNSFGTQTIKKNRNLSQQLEIPKHCRPTLPQPTYSAAHHSTSDFAMQFPFDVMDFGTQTHSPASDFADVATYMYEDSAGIEQTAVLSQSSTQTNFDYLLNDIHTQTDWQVY